MSVGRELTSKEKLIFKLIDEVFCEYELDMFIAALMNVHTHGYGGVHLDIYYRMGYVKNIKALLSYNDNENGRNENEKVG